MSTPSATVTAEMTCTKECTNVLAIEKVPCGLCGSLRFRRLFREEYRIGNSETELEISRCVRCGLVSTSPRLTFESVRMVYRDDAERTISHNYCWEGSADISRFTRLLARLKGVAPKGRLLDVGCGAGHFLTEAKRCGHWDVMGVEPSVEAAREARRRSGIEVLASTLEESSLQEGSFHIISMLGVLEHLHDPLGTLRLARSLLKPNGILATYVPNFNYLRLKDAGLACYLRKGCWSDLHPQEHLFHYTPATLGTMLDRGGFALLRLDIGRPFSHGGALTRLAKSSAYVAVCALRALTGLHLGGIEAICRRAD